MPTSGPILVVDDDSLTRRMLESVLRGAGFEVAHAESGAEALARIAELRPRLVLLDLVLPAPDGFEVLSRLRADPTTKHLPVIILTAREAEDEIARAFELGADDLARKPVQPAELLARIRSQLRIREYTLELARKERDAQVMLEVTQALASSLDFREILYTVVRRIAEVVRVERVSIVLAPEEGDVGYVVAASDDEQLSNLRIDLGKYPEIQRVLRSREPLTISDAATHPVLDGVRADVTGAGLGALSLLPIVWEDQAMGVLFLRATPQRGSLSDREIDFLRIVANATAVALRNARVMQSLKDHTQQVNFARFEAERRLRTLQRFADLFASASDGIAVMDPDGRLLFANPRAYEVTGYNESEMISRKLKDFIDASDADLRRELWERIAANDFPQRADLHFVRKDGSIRTLDIAFSAMHDGEGAVILSFRDVTEDRHLESELVKTKEFLESLIDASIDAIVAADMKGRIILFNKGAERIYGYAAKDVVGKMNVAALYPDDGAKEVMRMIRSPQYGGVGRLDVLKTEAVDSSGQRIPISLSAAMIYERSEPTATFGIFTDLRDRIRVEERLAQAQEKLAVTEKQALIAELAGTAAHELNQPLTSVMVYGELLQRRFAEGTTEHGAASTIVHEAERMADIVRKIGKITRYETKSYVGQQKILDLDKASSSGGSDPPADAEKPSPSRGVP